MHPLLLFCDLCSIFHLWNNRNLLSLRIYIEKRLETAVQESKETRVFASRQKGVDAIWDLIQNSSLLQRTFRQVYDGQVYQVRVRCFGPFGIWTHTRYICMYTVTWLFINHVTQTKSHLGLSSTTYKVMNSLSNSLSSITRATGLETCDVRTCINDDLSEVVIHNYPKLNSTRNRISPFSLGSMESLFSFQHDNFNIKII